MQGISWHIFIPISIVVLFFISSFYLQNKRWFVAINLSFVTVAIILISVQYFNYYDILPENVFNYF